MPAYRRIAQEAGDVLGHERSHLVQTQQTIADGTNVSAEYWGMTRVQIQEFWANCTADAVASSVVMSSMHDVVEHCVRPTTDGSGMGFAVFINQAQPKRVNLMISHSWAGNPHDFFEDVLRNMFDTEIAFICSLANYQGTSKELHDQLGNAPRMSPFSHAISSAAELGGRMLAVTNDNSQALTGLYGRLWTVWEMYLAWEFQLAVTFSWRNGSVTGDLAYIFGPDFETRSAGDAVTSMPQDSASIRREITKHPPMSSGMAAEVFACPGAFRQLDIIIVGATKGLINKTIPNPEYSKRFVSGYVPLAESGMLPKLRCLQETPEAL
eukprot:CAMPEP_0117551630 /NCGR_PEP_ID=MMETSP0784-20121206/49289_1 /TAXON_ID=39447 /ORGANISM="" /LENGTH=323 /DNA_ID=CAMNT_0005348673 /DNA_START=129 /DNA_END=1100 /DNA_ORIENTATION=+